MGSWARRDQRVTPRLNLIGGCHYPEYVLSDSHHAGASLGPNGVVAWHDYGQNRGVSDVVDALAMAMNSQKNGRGNARAFAIAGTRLAVAVQQKGLKQTAEAQEVNEAWTTERGAASAAR